MTEPASIRYNNPGAMWNGQLAERWGSKGAADLHDGLGQGNNSAIFPTKVQGAAAQFDLWRNRYVGMSLAAAIRKWSGGNSSPEYVAFLAKTADIDPQQIITGTLLASPRGLKLLQAQAQWEAGRPYPMTDAEWQMAQGMVFRGVVPPPAPPKPQPRSLIDIVVNIFKSIFRRK